MRTFFFIILFLVLSAPFPCRAVEDQLTNIPKSVQRARIFAPGALVRLPDGRETRIIEYLPGGSLKTELGLNLSPEGFILDENGQAQGTAPAIILGPEEARAEKEGQEAPRIGETPKIMPDNAAQKPSPENKAEISEFGKNIPQEQQQPKPQAPDISLQEKPKTQVRPQVVVPESQLSLAELIPLSTVPGESREKPAPEKKPETQKGKNIPPEKTLPKAEKKAEEKAAPGKKAPEKPLAQKNKKPALGEELQIPPEAAASGNLDFLEGCWQGTRPEYYSKRIVKECFCFDVNGGSGKRRVIDSIGGRKCIGASKANLSKNGVLTIISEGAACSDGAKWGQAEMICKKTGPKSPCTWVFKDAQGGRQSYEIPFVRVEACGR